MNRPLHIYSTAIAKDFPVYKLVAHQLRKFYPEATLYLITPSESNAKKYFEFDFPVQILDENEIVDRHSFCAQLPVQYMNRWSWYYQQMLKLTFPRVVGLSGDFLIWDADTIPIRKLSFQNEDMKILLTKGAYIHQPYFDTIDKLFKQKLKYHETFISQHLFFSKKLHSQFIKFVEDKNETKIKNIFSRLSSSHELCFSEYETFGNYLLNYHSDSVQVIERPWLHNPNLDNIKLDDLRTNILVDVFKRQDFVALEYYCIKDQLNKIDKLRYMNSAGQITFGNIKTKLLGKLL
jgi:hypothetical protein